MVMPPNNGTPPNPDVLLAQALRDSVQIPPSVTREGVISQFSVTGQRTTYLPPYGSRYREHELQRLYRMDEMSLIRGAVVGVAKAIASIPWEISGDESENETFNTLASQRGWQLKRPNGVEYFQEVFRNAQFGQGWGTFVAGGVKNFLTFDTGWYIEAVASGDSYDKPLGPIVGLANLDTLKTYPTGDPRYPAIYYDRWGGLHVMHHSRLIRMVDMLGTDDMIPGYGDSALSRSVSIAMQEIYQTRYITSRLDDQPPPGMDIMGGITRQEMIAVEAAYLTQQGTDRAPIFGKRLRYHTPDPTVMPKIESYEFSAAPEKFDWRVYTDILVDRLALTLGVDRQELMQLSGSGNLGSGAQSAILAAKSRGKTIGFLLQELERKLNNLLPEEYTFEFKYRDAQESLEQAQKMQIISAAVAAMGTALSPQEQRTLLSQEIEAVRDAISNTPRVNDVINAPIIAEDNTAGAAPVAQTANAPTVRVNDSVDDVVSAKAQKSYLDTQAMFIQDVRDLLVSAVTPNPYLDRRAFGVTMRSLLKRYGEQAYKDGMRQGGVTVDTLDPDDMADMTRIFIQQSQYVNGLADDVFKTHSITPANASSRAQMWGKSLQDFADGGTMSAASNAMFVWRRGFTSDSCVTCLRMDGQVHRFKTWHARGILPKSSRLVCKGYRCLCQLEKTTERARGRF